MSSPSESSSGRSISDSPMIWSAWSSGKGTSWSLSESWSESSSWWRRLGREEPNSEEAIFFFVLLVRYQVFFRIFLKSGDKKNADFLKIFEEKLLQGFLRLVINWLLLFSTTFFQFFA